MLVRDGERGDGSENGVHVEEGGLDEGEVVDVDEESYEELAVHAIGDAAVARDELVEILLFERSFHCRREESAEWCKDGREECKDDGVQLYGHDAEVGNERGQGDGSEGLERVNGEKWRKRARSLRRRRQLSRSATEHIEASQKACSKEAHHNGNHSSANKAFPSLVWRKLRQGLVDELATNRHADEISHNIVTDDH